MKKSRLWVFGYGSLMWNPGFSHDRAEIARLNGYARSFCMRSIHHRGTLANPGLVLALDPTDGAFCTGMALRVSTGSEQDTILYLRERELVSSAYLETTLQIQLADGEKIDAVTFVVDVDHEQYCGGLPLDEQAQIIAAAVGGRGKNSDYLNSTADHLAGLGIKDTDLDWLANAVKNNT
ncbi:MAG: gamma-glutamylcyclotransferase [Paracoccaceae bacterium]